MRALLQRLGLAREEAPDPALDRAAEAIVANLRALGLYVAAKAYGPRFVEIVASTSPKLVTTPGNAEASGVALLLAQSYNPPTLVFEEINSLQLGLGRRMVEAVLQGLATAPEGPFRKIRVDDASPLDRNGASFWRRIAAEHAGLAWEITESERGQPEPSLDGSCQQEP